ncbi:unnamed protein product [Amoebophrya sp. A25]|nr:unnamed protein product [Amoebophrya sp. A25]|eukprot:GSA25T00020982001.1
MMRPSSSCSFPLVPVPLFSGTRSAGTLFYSSFSSASSTTTTSVSSNAAVFMQKRFRREREGQMVAKLKRILKKAKKIAFKQGQDELDLKRKNEIGKTDLVRSAPDPEALVRKCVEFVRPKIKPILGCEKPVPECGSTCNMKTSSASEMIPSRRELSQGRKIYQSKLQEAMAKKKASKAFKLAEHPAKSSAPARSAGAHAA